LPLCDIGWGRNAFRKLIRRIEFFILYELAQPFGTLLVIIQFQEPKLGGPDGRAYEFIHVALVLGIEEEFTVLSNMLLELFLKLDHVLQNQLLLWRVFLVVYGGVGVLELSTPFQLLVDHVLSFLEEFIQLLLLPLVVVF